MNFSPKVKKDNLFPRKKYPLATQNKNSISNIGPAHKKKYSKIPPPEENPMCKSKIQSPVWGGGNMIKAVK